jgi:hypothetical protein
MQEPTNEPEIGYIYCLSNESYEGTYKIGFTKNDPLIRMSQLNTTGLLYSFKLEFAKQVKNYQDKEKKLHLIFDKYRVNKSREFFKMELKEIKQLFDLIDGDWYKSKEPLKLLLHTDSRYKPPTVVSKVESSSEKTSLFGSNSKQPTYSSTDGNTIVKTLVKNMEQTFCNPYIKKDIVSNEMKTHCSRCYDKLTIFEGIIKCKHLDICKECINAIKKCPKCKVPYDL